MPFKSRDKRNAWYKRKMARLRLRMDTLHRTFVRDDDRTEPDPVASLDSVCEHTDCDTDSSETSFSDSDSTVTINSNNSDSDNNEKSQALDEADWEGEEPIECLESQLFDFMCDNQIAVDA